MMFTQAYRFSALLWLFLANVVRATDESLEHELEEDRELAVATYSEADVANHNTASDCWTALKGNVYELTAYIPLHCGGAAVISALCGRTGLLADTLFAVHPDFYLLSIEQYFLGELDGATPGPVSYTPSTTTTYSLNDVEAHKTLGDCWAAFNGYVYDITTYLDKHCGGVQVLSDVCGTDANTTFTQQHPVEYAALISDLLIGKLSVPVAAPTAAPTAAPASGGGFCFPGDAIVEVKGKGNISLDKLQIGDEVLVGNLKFEPVYSFAHKDVARSAQYLQLTTDSGATLEISKQHLIFAERGHLPASHVKPGDKLYLAPDGRLDVVKEVKNVTRKGVYAPLTYSGSIVVNSFKVSAYVALQDSAFLQIGGVSTGISYHWAEHAFELPHRLWCQYVTSCKDEKYIDGISTWAHAPKMVAHWFLGQNALVMGMVFLPFLMYLGLLSLVDLMLSNSILVFTAAAIYLGAPIFQKRKKFA